MTKSLEETASPIPGETLEQQLARIEEASKRAREWGDLGSPGEATEDKHKFARNLDVLDSALGENVLVPGQHVPESSAPKAVAMTELLHDLYSRQNRN